MVPPPMWSLGESGGVTSALARAVGTNILDEVALLLQLCLVGLKSLMCANFGDGRTVLQRVEYKGD
jgi:hypothetical protein